MLRWFKALDRVLKGDATRPDALQDGSVQIPVAGLAAVTLLLGAVYGGCMGAFAVTARWATDSRADGYFQLLASAAKVPLLFLLTLLITFPSLYVFNALLGSRLSAGSVLRLTIAALAVLMAVLASFGTIVVFFSLCTTSYPFMVLLNVATFSLAGLLGMAFLLRTLNRLSIAKEIQEMNLTAAPPAPAVERESAETPPAPPYVPMPGALQPSPHALGRGVSTVFRIWVLLFAIVGSQMGWVLRPFIGNPNDPFTFFRDRDDSNVFEAIVVKIKQATGNWPESKRGWGPRRSAPPGRGKHAPATQPQGS